MTPNIIEHLASIENRIEEYFPSTNIQDLDRVRDPSADLIVIISHNFEFCKEEEPASISSDRGLKLKHAQLPLDAFWISVKNEYSV